MESQRLGATYLGDGATQFVVWAPKASRVELHLPQADRQIEMMSAERGYFSAVVETCSPGTFYKYRLDGQVERPDPASRCQPQGVHGPSMVIDHRFSRPASTWRGLELRDYVIYELHIGTFTETGTLPAIIPHLDRLKSLGITAIELMPVSQFPGTRNWGYDGVYPFAVQHSYGGADQLKQFVAACHERELAVVLDVVYNHLGPEGNYLADFGPYFTGKYHTPWGHAINFDQRCSDEVRRYFNDNALEWITDYHVDALRLDAIHAIYDQSARPFLAELTDAVHRRAAELGRRVYLIGETNENKPALLQPTMQGGIGLDGQWLEDFHRSLHALLTGERQSFYADFGSLADFAKAYGEGFVLTGQYSKYRGRKHGASSSEFTTERFVVSAQNHDQTGNRACGERYTTLLDFESRKLAAAAVILSPYIPLLFMGEEYGEPAPFAYFVDHGEPYLLESVRQGRLRDFKGCWTTAPPDPASAETFQRSRLSHDLAAQSQHALTWAYYQKLLELRRTIGALRQIDRQQSKFAAHDGLNLLVAQRATGHDSVYLLYHFAAAPLKISADALALPTGSTKLLDSADPLWDGPGSLAPDKLSTGDTLTLAPRCCIVYHTGQPIR